MAILSEIFSINSKGGDLIDITAKVKEYARNLSISDALVNICVNSSTSCVIISDNPKNLTSFLETTIPMELNLKDGNIERDIETCSKIKASLLPKSVNVVLKEGLILLDDVSKIVLVDFGMQSSIKNVTMTFVY